jgi:hypothetical protein
MARLSFRDRFFTPPVGRALTSPLSILVFGAAAAVGIAVGAPIVAAIGIGVAAYGGRVALSVPKNKRSSNIDPFSLKEPWRGYVQSAQSAKQRFDRTVASTKDGPIRERLAQLAGRLEDGIEESWRIACRGDDIDGAIAQLDTRQAQQELAELQAQVRGRPVTAEIDETIRSLQAQINSSQRMAGISTSTRNRLRLLDARFDELVARAVEVSIGTGDSGVLGDDVDELVTELESLRLAMDDTNRAERGDTTGLPSPRPAPSSGSSPGSPASSSGSSPGSSSASAPAPDKPQTWPPQ